MRICILALLALMSLSAHAESTLKLSEVVRFDGRAVGYAATESQNYQAFRAEVERGEAAAPLFEELLKTGTPAAKLYSALGLYHLDRERGVKALQSLSGDTTKVSEMNGCMVDETTVGATAKMLLGDNEAVARAYLPR